MTELEIDREFNIDTCGRDDSKEDKEHRAYEPTPYDVLDLLIDNDVINKNDHVVDMGAGKGRVSIYLSHEIGCHVTGVEYDPDIYNLAQINLYNVKPSVDVDFECISAEKYNVKSDDTVFFFFNPFSVKILNTVINNIEKSFYENMRSIKLIFYYPTLEYVGTLMTRDRLEFVDEIDCSHLYKDSKGRECIMIFKFIL